MPEEAKIQIPYVPFNTFINAIEAMEHTLPPRLDKSMWKNFSGAIQSQLWSAFKFFRLVGVDGAPTEALVRLVRDRVGRKANLKSLLTDYYPELMALDLSTATLGHFNETMRIYNLGAETQKKASSFFLQAAKAAGVPLSTYIMSNTRTPGIKRAKRNNASKSKANPAPTPLNNGVEAHIGTGPHLTIQLDRDITLTLSASADTFKMTPQDRKFVMEILAKLESHVASDDGEDAEDMDGIVDLEQQSLDSVNS
jgi:hypothetical protein